MRPTHK